MSGKEGSDRLKLVRRYAMVDMGNQEARKSVNSKHDAGTRSLLSGALTVEDPRKVLGDQ